MPRRVLLLVTDLKTGGTPTVVRELALRLREPGRVDVEVVCLAPRGEVAGQLRAAGVAVTAFGATSSTELPAAVARLARLIRGGSFDTVVSFLVHANAVAALARPFCPGVRFLQSIQTTQPNPRWHWRVQRLIAPAADAVVVPSSSAADVATRWAGVPCAVVIPNAVDVAAYADLYAANAGRPAGSPVRVGFLGRLDPVKRVPDLLAAVAGEPDVRLDVFGDGADRPRVERAVDRLGLRAVATLRGAVARPRDALASLDVLVLPSEAEGFGLVLIEAMAAGVPVVATDVPGVRDVVAAGRTGLLVPVGHPDALRRAIRRAADPAWRARVMPAARADVERRFAWPAVLAAYRRVLGI